MDIKQIEFAVEKFYEMCRAHPEICPHDYHWAGSTTNKITKECTERYICGLCGDLQRKTVKKE